MSRLGPAIVLLTACTTVVQEPADLQPEKVDALRIEPRDDGTVRIDSPDRWTEAGALLLWNRLTAERVDAVVDEAGILDAIVPGSVDDAFALARRPDGPRVQFVVQDGDVRSGWAWGFVGEDGACAQGDFHGELVAGPESEGLHRRCLAAGIAGDLGADTWAVFADRIALELVGEAPRLRFWVRGRVDADVHVLVVAGGDEYLAARPLLGLVAESGVTLGFGSDELRRRGDDAPLTPGALVESLWIYVEGGHAAAFHLQVDDVVFESVVPAAALE